MYGSNRTFRHQELGALPTGGDHVWVPAFAGTTMEMAVLTCQPQKAPRRHYVIRRSRGRLLRTMP